jgi:hypothetical protein
VIPDAYASIDPLLVRSLAMLLVIDPSKAYHAGYCTLSSFQFEMSKV